MIKKGCLLGALFSVSLLVAAADPPAKKAVSPRAKESTPWEVLLKEAPNNKLLRTVACPSSPGGSCKIVVTMGDACDTNRKPQDEYLKVRKDVTIFWQLDNATSRKWRFDGTDGVTFDDPLAPFDGKGNPSPVVFQYHSKPDAGAGLYNYKIKLVPKNGGPACLIDPAIWI